MNDPHPPQPDQGWSREIINLKNAIVVPPRESRPRTPSGVWKDGDIAEAAMWRGSLRMSLPLPEAPVTTKTLQGNYLFGGMFYGHFGHFITETTSRLWAVNDIYDGIVFTPKHAVFTHFKKPHRELFSILGINCPTLILSDPTIVENLAVPGQGFGLGDIALGTEEFINFLHENIRKIPANGPDKIYISRTKYVAEGGILGEMILEENLRRSGYTAVFPEQLTWTDQMALYRAARKIISLDTSALHMAGFAANPDKDIAIILRRNNAEHRNIQLQLRGMMGKDPLLVNSLAAEYIVPGKKANHNSWGQADFNDLHATLLEHDYLDPGAEWDIPSDDVIRADLAEAERRANTSLVYTPVEKRFGQ